MDYNDDKVTRYGNKIILSQSISYILISGSDLPVSTVCSPNPPIGTRTTNVLVINE